MDNYCTWFCLHYFYCISFNFRRGKLSFKWTSFYGGRGLGLIDWSTCEWVLHLAECHFWTFRSKLKFVGKNIDQGIWLVIHWELVNKKWKILLTAIIQTIMNSCNQKQHIFRWRITAIHCPCYLHSIRLELKFVPMKNFKAYEFNAFNLDYI